MLKRIGAEEGGEFKAIASGTLPSGKPVVVNADGTVSVVSETSYTQSVGDAVALDATISFYMSATYDTANDKVVVAYKDNTGSGEGRAIVGTVSGNSISFGTPVAFSSNNIAETSITFDSSNGKVFIAYTDTNNSSYGTGVVGTVSGTSISFGTAVSFNNGTTTKLSTVFDSSNNKVVVAYRDDSQSDYGKAIVGTISGTSVSFGSEVTFNAANTVLIKAAYDVNANRIVIVYRDMANSSYGTAVVGTVSGTSISFGSEVVFESADTRAISSAYDSDNQKILVAFKLASNNTGYAIVGTVSGTSISFGSKSQFTTNNVDVTTTVYDSGAQKCVILYRNQTTSPYSGRIFPATISGTSVSFGTETTWTSTSFSEPTMTYDPDQGKAVFVYKDANNNQYFTARVFQTGYTQQNLTSENYIGMSRGGVSQAQTIGSSVTFESAITQNIASIFDSSNNKVVITYQDGGNSSYGTAVVGDVSGSSISFGTPVVFESASNGVAALTFDSNSNKVVLAYHDSSNSDYGTSRVGTVSGTSISFGSAAVYESAVSYYNAIDFDSNLNKVVIAYRDQGNSNYGTAVVGTVSGTSISFGTPVVFNAGSVEDCSVIFDSSNNKTVILYKDTANSNYGTAIVGTVSGTSISFGSEVAFNSAATTYPIGIFDPSSSKIVIAFRDEGDSNNGKVMVGTVSGTSISFGSEVLYASGITGNGSGIAYDSENNQIILVYQDATNGTVKTGTVSGSTVTLSSAVEFNSVDSKFNRVVFDSNSKVSVISYTDDDNSKYGKALVFKQDIRGQVADGGNASMDIIGSVSTNQSGLTAGQQYFVQTDGTISTTADDPSVLAGTAISATELVVKT